MDAAADPLQTPRQAEGPEPAVKPAESQDDGYETSNSGEARRRGATPARSPPPPPPQAFAPYDYTFPYKFPGDGGYPPHNRDAYVTKRDCDDPYSFVEEEACMLAPPPPHPQQPPPLMPPHHHHHMMMAQPKKRGRKKKIKDENGMEIKCEVGLEGALVVKPVKERKKHDRFNGMSEEEVARRTLPDHLAENLDIIIIGINPGLFAAYKGHHYAGPGNHFWKCLYLSGLTREQMSADEDYKLLNFGIGFTNMVARPTKGSADLNRREIKEGSAILLEKLQTFRPKVAVFNGKLIYEVFSGKKDFCFGKQPDTVTGTNTYMWVMPSSSARCAQLPRAADKVPFYAALKKFRDYLNGLVPHVTEEELVFPDTTGRRPQEELEIRRLTTEPEPGDTIILEDGTEVPIKKKRGRPKKVKLENGEVAPPTPRAPRAPRPPPSLDSNGEPPKKKRGRPKKIRPDDPMFLQHQANQLLQQQQQQQQQQSQQQQQQQSQQQQQLGGMMEQQYNEQYQQPLMFHQPYHPQSMHRSNTPCGMEVQQQPLHSMQDQYVYSPPRRHFSPHQTPTRYSHSPAPLAGRSTPYAASPAAFPAAAASPAAFPAASPAYTSRTHTPIAPQGGSSCGSAASGGCALGAASPHAPSPLHAVDFSPPPTVQSSVGVEESGESSVAALCPLYDNERLYDCHPGGSDVAESPRLDQMHQHPGIYQTNYNRATPDGSSEAFSPSGGFRRSEAGDGYLHSDPATHHDHVNNYSQEHADSPGEFSGTVKPKPQDVASKSLSGLESLVDQIPSIAEGGAAAGAAAGAAPGAGGPQPPADNAPALDYPPLYPPYPPYGTPPYANNGGRSNESSVGSYGGWVGYGGGWGVGGVVRGAGYLPDWQYPYCPSYYPQPYLQYPQQQTHYLSTPGLLDLHKNGEHSPGVGGVPAVPSVPSVGFGGFC